jgi:hypothetical protein
MLKEPEKKPRLQNYGAWKQWKQWATSKIRQTGGGRFVLGNASKLDTTHADEGATQEEKADATTNAKEMDVAYGTLTDLMGDNRSYNNRRDGKRRREATALKCCGEVGTHLWADCDTRKKKSHSAYLVEQREREDDRVHSTRDQRVEQSPRSQLKAIRDVLQGRSIESLLERAEEAENYTTSVELNDNVDYNKSQLEYSRYLIDNAAQVHVSRDNTNYLDKEYCNVTLRGVNNTAAIVNLRGTIILPLLDENGKTNKLKLSKTLYVPESPKNIIALQLLENKNTIVVQENNLLTLTDKSTGERILTGFKDPLDK